MTDEQINLAIGAITHAEHIMDFPDVILDALNSVIVFLATMDDEQRKSGHWINEGRFANYHGGNVYRCSQCGNRIVENEPDDFCKHCGSENRGGGE